MPSRIDRALGAAGATADHHFCAQTIARLPEEAIDRLDKLALDYGASSGGSGRSILAELKADPGPLGLETVLAEIEKLHQARSVGLPPTLFAGVSERLVATCRSRAARQYPSDLQAMAAPVRRTLLAALCSARVAEITDGLVDLLIQLVHRINARAERRVEGEMIADLRRVAGKEALLYRLAEAALEHPDETVREALYPVVGEATLRDLVSEGRTNQATFKRRVRTVLRSSYSSYYRRMLPQLVDALSFRCNNTAYRPVMDALELLRRYADRDRVRFYDAHDRVPLSGVVPTAWREAVVDDRGRVERIPYELCVLTALRDAIRRREIWVEGAARWRDPETDLPADFELNRDVHYAAIRQPQDPTAFVAGLRRRLDEALAGFASALKMGGAGGVHLTRRHGQPWISVPRLETLPEPTGLEALKAELVGRYGTIDLLDILKDADHLTELTGEFTSVASREAIPRERLRRRLLLVLFAMGTNMGIRQMVATGDHGETEAALRHVRRHFVTRDNLRRAVTRLVNATFAVRDRERWGDGTACASDSKRFGAWDSNLLTQWHVRYGGPGVMIYSHVERKAACIHSQLTSCSASEIAAMLEGLLRHCTDAEVEANYTDSHGASIIGFAFTELLGFRLLPRLKNIGSIQLYHPDDDSAYPGARRGPHPRHPLGADHPAVRSDGQVRDGASAGDGGGRAGAAALHPRRSEAPHLQGARGARPSSSGDLRLPIPDLATAAPRDPRGVADRRAVEQRKHRPLLRHGRRVDRRRPRAPGGLDAGVAPPAVGAGARQHAAGPARPRRRGLAWPAQLRRSPRPDAALLVTRQPLRPVPPRHGDPPRSRRGGMTQRDGAVRIAIYARVSTIDKDQNPETQLPPLRHHVGGLDGELLGEFVDHASADDLRGRHEWRRLIELAMGRHVDLIVVWKLDRAFRSVADGATTLQTLRSCRCGIRSLQEPWIDTTTAIGEAMYHITLAWAQLEKKQLTERVKAGLERARAEGKHLGRPARTKAVTELPQWPKVLRALTAGHLTGPRRRRSSECARRRSSPRSDRSQKGVPLTGSSRTPRGAASERSERKSLGNHTAGPNWTRRSSSAPGPLGRTTATGPADPCKACGPDLRGPLSRPPRMRSTGLLLAYHADSIRSRQSQEPRRRVPRKHLVLWSQSAHGQSAPDR